MSDFSASDAAFAGVRFARTHWRAIAIWAAVILIVALVAGVLMVQMAGPAMMQMQALATTRSTDRDASMAALRKIAPVYALILPFSLLYYTVLFTAMNRAVLQPQDQSFAFLRLGLAELRQFLLTLLGLLVAFLLQIVLYALGGVVVYAAFLALKQPGIMIILVVLPAVFCAMIYVWVRLSLASPLTFDRGKVDLFGSWRLTKGRFWKLLGAYVLTLFMAAVVALGIMIVCMALSAVLGGGVKGMGELMRPDVSSLGAYFAPAQLVVIVIWSGASALLWPIVLMPAAEIYRRLKD